MATPSGVKAYLKQNRRLSHSYMTVHFGVSDETMHGLLAPWLAKNEVQRIDSSSHCKGSCSKASCCGTVAAPVYEWCEPH